MYAGPSSPEENVAKFRKSLSDADLTHRQNAERLLCLNHQARHDIGRDELRLDTTSGPLDVLSSVKRVGNYARVPRCVRRNRILWATLPSDCPRGSISVQGVPHGAMDAFAARDSGIQDTSQAFFAKALPM